MTLIGLMSKEERKRGGEREKDRARKRRTEGGEIRADGEKRTEA